MAMKQNERELLIRCSYCGVVEPGEHFPWCPWFEVEDENEKDTQD